MSDDKVRKDIWLFLSKDDQIALYDGENQYTLKQHNDLLRLTHQDIKSGHTQSWSDFFPQTLINTLSSFVDTDELNYLYLHIDNNLNLSWKNYLWENLSLSGKPMMGRIVVERDSVIDLSSFSPKFLNADLPSVFLNMFPENELEDKKSLRKKVVSLGLQFERNAKLSVDYCHSHDLSSLAMLVVFIHGSEQEVDNPPFILPDNSQWQLPETALPSIVLLLSCSSQSGNLSAYSRSLLSYKDKGPKVVISANAKINSTQIIEFFIHFWSLFKSGKSIGDALRIVQGSSGQEDGAQKLCLFGNGNIRIKPEQIPLVEESTNTLSQLFKNQLLNQQNLDFDITSILLERAVYLQELNGIPWDITIFSKKDLDSNKINEIDFFNHMLKLSNQFSCSIKCHLYPYLILLAEKNNHAVMNQLKNEYTLFHYRCRHLAVSFYRSCLYDYRNGDYKNVFNHFLLARKEDDFVNYKSQFYRLVLSISTDLMLPELGKNFEFLIKDALDDLSEVLPGELINNEEWASKDSLSRHYLRLGKIEKSRVLMTHKLRDAEQYDSNREKSWLLYTSSIGNLSSSKSDAKIILQEIGPFADMTDKWGQGNTDIAYQIRALSLWCYQYQQSQIASDLLKNLLSTVSTLLSSDKIRDYAPIGFSLIFLKLAVESVPMEYESVWKSVSAQMEEYEYYAELMGLYILSNDLESALECTDKFHRFRRRAVKPLLDIDLSNLTEFSSIDLKAAINERETIEKKLLNQMPFDNCEPKSLIHCLVQAQVMPQ